MTLPLIAALRDAPEAERRRIRALVRKRRKSRQDVAEVQAFVRDRGGIAYARAEMLRRAQEAAERFATFPPTPARDALLDVAAYVVARKR